MCGASGLSAECTWADKSVRRLYEEWKSEEWIFSYLLELFFMGVANLKKNTQVPNKSLEPKKKRESSEKEIYWSAACWSPSSPPSEKTPKKSANGEKRQG